MEVWEQKHERESSQLRRLAGKPGEKALARGFAVISNEKILAAARHNWWLSLAGLLLSFGASVVLVRAMPQELYAQYAAVIAIIGLATFVFEAGANSGLTRYLREAGEQDARGTLYRMLLRRRWLAALACGIALFALGPIYARVTQFDRLAAQPYYFLLIAAIVAGNLTRLLAHYGLLALFETKVALLFQQCFLVLRSVVLAAIALAGGSLLALLAALVGIAVVEAVIMDRRLWLVIGGERASIPASFVNRAQTFGLLTIFDKGCAMLGSGTILLLLLAPRHPVATIALLALAVDLVGKVLSLTVMPMGNLVAPYLSGTSDDRAAQALATARVVKLSSLLYSSSVAAALLLFPWLITTVYGVAYAGATTFVLLLLLPTAFENWIRGCCSPALLRNGRYRELARLNAIQAILTIGTLVLVYAQPVEIVLVAVGAVRSAVAAFNLLLLRRIVPAHTYRVPLQAAVVGLLSCATAYLIGLWLALPPMVGGCLQGVIFAITFYAGMRWLVLRDEDTLRLAHRIAGGHVRFFARLLPPQLSNA